MVLYEVSDGEQPMRNLDTQILPLSSWQRCEYCGGALVELDPYVLARCAVCSTDHAWDHEDAAWFGVGESRAHV